MQTLYEAYKDNDKVRFFFVYVREAHPSRRAAAPDPETKGHRDIGRHRTIQSKVIAASKCLKGLKFTIPFLIDGMDGSVEKAYKGKPAATAVIDLDGKIALHTRGPSGCRPRQAEKVIKQLIARGGLVAGAPRKWPTTAPATRPAANKPAKRADTETPPTDRTP